MTSLQNKLKSYFESEYTKGANNKTKETVNDITGGNNANELINNITGGNSANELINNITGGKKKKKGFPDFKSDDNISVESIFLDDNIKIETPPNNEEELKKDIPDEETRIVDKDIIEEEAKEEIDKYSTTELDEGLDTILKDPVDAAPLQSDEPDEEEDDSDVLSKISDDESEDDKIAEIRSYIGKIIQYRITGGNAKQHLNIVKIVNAFPYLVNK